MGIFGFGKNAREESERLAAEQAESDHVVAEERRKLIEEEEKKRQEEEIKKRMAVYDNFDRYTSVDCKVFAEARFECAYDDIQFMATIRPQREYLDSSYLLADGSYNEDKYGGLKPDLKATTISLDLKMLYDQARGSVLFPRIKMSCWFNRFGDSDTIKKIVIKVGGNRYYAVLTNVTKYIESTNYGSHEETDYSTLCLGLKDIDILKEIAEGKYRAYIQLGEGKGKMSLSEKDVAGVKEFITVCEKAGVFEQAALTEEENKFVTLTKFNP